jgi:hypothetical protein
MKKFSLKQKLLPSVIAATLASGVAFTGNANALEVAADGTGQVLLGPIYFVPSEGAVNQIKVINTSFTHAVKARIAFRSRINSTEVLDFLLYLSPGDIWRGEVRNIDGQAYVTSTDDSVRNLPLGDSFASIKEAKVQMFDINLSSNDDNEIGHFEVIGAYSATGIVQTAPGESVTIKQGMSKFDLAKIFDKPLKETLLPLNSCVGATVGCVLRTDEPNTVQLRGEVSLDLGGDRFSYLMTALDADGTEAENKVISNPNFDLRVTMHLDLGKDFVSAGVRFDQDNILDIEEALAAKSYGASYENTDVAKSFVLVAFPTKYRHANNSDPCKTGVSGMGTRNVWTPPFNQNGDVNYSINQLDNQENGIVSSKISVSGGQSSTTTITPEVEWFLPEWQFQSGWYSLNLNAAFGCPYVGVPAVVNTLTFEDTEGLLIQNSPL